MSRSARIEEFLESFQATKSPGTELILGLDNADPEYAAYMALTKKYDFAVGVFEGENITKIFNAIALNESEYAYYMPTNDDFVFKTSGWDNELISTIEKNGKGIAYGNDLFQGENCPATSIISGEIVRALGWLQLPELTHLYGDRVWYMLGRGAKCLYYRDDVIIEHKHFVANKGEKDAIADKTNSDAMYNADGQVFANWLSGQAKSDLEKVIAICKNTVV